MAFGIIDSHMPVRYCGRETKLCMVTHNAQFQVVETGKLYAARATETTFRNVPMGGRFKIAHAWFVREVQGVRSLDPNLPFGQPFDKPMSRFSDSRPVTLVTVESVGASATPELKIAGKGAARLGASTHCFMQDLRILQEFASGGHSYQLTKKPSSFGKVPLKGRFCYHDKWYMKTAIDSAKLLDPNAPLADTCGVVVVMKPAYKVAQLEVMYRGEDEKSRSHEPSSEAHAHA